jgi:hypothetical protein
MRLESVVMGDQPPYGLFDSSQTRVRPVLEALEAARPDGGWVADVVAMATPGLPIA